MFVGDEWQRVTLANGNVVYAQKSLFFCFACPQSLNKKQKNSHFHRQKSSYVVNTFLDNPHDYECDTNTFK